MRPPSSSSSGPSYGRLLALVRPYAGPLTAASIIVVGISGVTLIAPRLAGYVLDAALIERNVTRLDRVLLVLLGLFAMRGLLRYAQIYLVHSSGARLLASLRGRLLDHLLRLSPAFFAERHTGELVSRITTDIGKIQNALIDRVPDGVQAVITFTGTVIMLFVIRAELAVLTLVVVPPVVVTALFFGRRLMRLSTRTADAAADATQVATEALSGLQTVQAFGGEGAEGRKHAQRLDAMVELEKAYARLLGSFSGIMQFTGFGAFAVVLWYGGSLVADGRMSPGELTSFLLYTFSVAGAIGTLGSLYSTLKSLRGASARVFEILDTVPTIVSPANAIDSDPFEGRLRLSDVVFSYPSRSDEPVLRGVDLDIAANEMVALVGPSGGGKSTLFALLLRFYDPDRGTIELDGHDLRKLPLEQLRAAIGLVPQDIFLFSGTIDDNIRYGASDASDDDVRRAAVMAGAAEFIDRLPGGMSEIVGERGIRLSVGQRQRIAIARAFLRQPRVLLLDEATSALDPDSEAIVQRALEELMRGRTTLVIAHRLATAKRASRILVVDGGRVIDSGTHEALYTHSEVYRRYWELQSLAS